jgi:AcrR family transcriptional regulator
MTEGQIEKARRRAMVEHQREQAFGLRVAGASYREIGKLLGVSATAAWKYVRSVMEQARERTLEHLDDYRDIELQRTDAIIRALWNRKDDPATAKAIALQQKLRLELLGLSAPVRIQPVLPEEAGDAQPDFGSLTNEELRQLRDLHAKALGRGAAAQRVLVGEVVVVGGSNGEQKVG